MKVSKRKRKMSFEKPPMQVKKDLKLFEVGVSRLKELETELDNLDTRGFSRDEQKTRAKLKNVSDIPTIENEIKFLKEKIQRKYKPKIRRSSPYKKIRQDISEVKENVEDVPEIKDDISFLKEKLESLEANKNIRIDPDVSFSVDSGFDEFLKYLKTSLSNKIIDKKEKLNSMLEKDFKEREKIFEERHKSLIEDFNKQRLELEKQFNLNKIVLEDSWKKRVLKDINENFKLKLNNEKSKLSAKYHRLLEENIHSQLEYRMKKLEGELEVKRKSLENDFKKEQRKLKNEMLAEKKNLIQDKKKQQEDFINKKQKQQEELVKEKQRYDLIFQNKKDNFIEEKQKQQEELVKEKQRYDLIFQNKKDNFIEEKQKQQEELVKEKQKFEKKEKNIKQKLSKNYFIQLKKKKQLIQNLEKLKQEKDSFGVVRKNLLKNSQEKLRQKDLAIDKLIKNHEFDLQNVKQKFSRKEQEDIDKFKKELEKLKQEKDSFGVVRKNLLKNSQEKLRQKDLAIDKLIKNHEFDLQNVKQKFSRKEQEDIDKFKKELENEFHQKLQSEVADEKSLIRKQLSQEYNLKLKSQIQKHEEELKKKKANLEILMQEKMREVLN